MRILNKIFILFTIIFLVFFVGSINSKLASYKGKEWFAEVMSYLPQSETVKKLTFGFYDLYANYIWMKCVLYFGEEYLGAKNFTWIPKMLDITTKLNPNFYPAYEFAGIILPVFNKDYTSAIILLNRGLNHIEDNYRIPMYLGWIYYNYLDEIEKAAHYMSVAASCRNVPLYIVKLSATLYSRAGKKEIGIKFLQSIYMTTQNPTVKKAIEDKLKELTEKSDL